MTRRQHPDDLTRLALPEQPALSPDGAQAVYVLTTVDAVADRSVRSLWRVAAVGPPAGRRLTRGEADSAPAWSPDGTSIAFLRAESGPPQVWLLPADGGEPERLTTLPLGAGAPVWSPDGEKIAFTAPVDQRARPDERQHLDETTRARRAARPLITDRLGYKADGAGMLGQIRAHLHVLDVRTREVRQVTDGDWHAGAPAWSPDSARLAFSAATAPDADLNHRAPVYVLDVIQPAAQPFLAGLLRLPADASGGPVTGLRVTDLAAPLDRNVMPGGPGYPGALPGLAGDEVLFCVRDRGCTHLYATRADGTGTPRPVIAGAGRSVSGMSAAAGIAAVVLATPVSFGEIVTVDLATGEESVRTSHGDPDLDLFAREDREFAISDGTTVNGWLIRDPDRAGERQPLLLDIHGGPHNAWNGTADPVHIYHQELAARGWTVLILNPRGSDGYGERFYTAAVGAWGEADARDFLEPVDALVAEGLADPGRLTVTGYSYGGYMTCFLTSRDDRFAAAVAGGAVSDLTSMGGTSDLGHLLSEIELGLAPWAGRDRFDPMSPLSRIGQVRTPTLLLHGAADLRCPPGQAEQWHAALRARGVPARLVLYPDASHLFILNGTPSQRIDYNQRVVDWVTQYTSAARRPRTDAAHWQRRLEVLARRHRVPGAALGILRVQPGAADPAGDDLAEAVYGTLNADTGVAATTGSLFQIGSITKVWTATVAMQLADEGLLDLDAPVADVLPEFRLADPDIAKQLTMRHLLTHTSGIDGDLFADTGRGDDCLEKYVALLAEARQNHPPGATWSYCNAGFSVIGRVIEKLAGTTWDAALRERLIAPLGLRHTVTLPEEALLFRTAAGHVETDPLTVAPAWGLPRSVGPAGLICATAADLLAFARLHLTGGLAADGTRVLSAASAQAMTDFQVELPDQHTLGDSWGLGWIRFGWGGHRLIGHDGNTIGQSAFLRLLPEAGLAVALLVNGGSTRDLYQDLYREIFAELAGVDMPLPLAPAAHPPEADITPYLGSYERASARLEVMSGREGPVLRTTALGPLADLMPDPESEYAMIPVEPGLYVVREPDSQTWTPVTFYELGSGERYVHFGARATPKAG